MVSSQQLGKLIQKARQNGGLTQDQLSDKAGLSYSTLAKIERGAIKNPSFFTILSLAHALKTDVDTLLGGAQQRTRRYRDARIRFVYCDMNGVMVRFYQRAFTTLSEETGCSIDAIETTFWHYNAASNRGEMSMPEFNRAMAQRLHVKRIDWQKHYMAAVEPIETMHVCLVNLIHAGFSVGLLTNTMPGFVEHMLAHKLLPKLKYAQIIDSSAVGCIKPELSIYEIAQQKAGVRPEEILFVDDSRTNLMAAEKLGWKVLWFDDYRPSESAQRIQKALAAHE